MQTILLEILKIPYVYIVVGVLVIVFMCLLLHKRTKSILENLNIRVKKSNELTINGMPTRLEHPLDSTLKIKNVEIINSKTGDIEGKVSVNDVKIDNSTIGSIKGK